METTAQIKTVTISAKQLKSTLAVFRKIVARHKVPILGCIFLSDGIMRVTDLDVEVSWNGRIDRSIKAAIPVKALTDALKGAKPASEVTLVFDADNLLIVRHGRLQAEIKMIDYKEAPPKTVGELIGKQIIVDELDERLTDAGKCMSSDENRYILNGVYMENTGNLVATDGRQLIKIPTSALASLPKSAIIPAKCVDLFKLAALKERPVGVQLAFKGPSAARDFESAFAELVHFTMGDGEWSVTSKLVQGRFPGYNQVIPKNTPDWIGFLKELDVERITEFLQALPEKSRVRMTITGAKMELHSIGENSNNAYTFLDGIMTPSKTKVDIAFASRFLLNCLESKCWNWSFTDEYSPLLASGPEQRKTIVMPVRLDKPKPVQ